MIEIMAILVSILFILCFINYFALFDWLNDGLLKDIPKKKVLLYIFIPLYFTYDTFFGKVFKEFKKLK